LSDGPLVAEPTWTRYDNLADCRCFGFDWQRGRQDEFDVSAAGQGRVFFHDRSSTLDDDDLVGLQIMLQLYNPVTATWEPCFRGHIEDISRDPSPNAPELTNVEVECVGIFAYLAGVKMVVGHFGATLPSGMTGVVFYEDGPVATGTNDPTDGGRIELLLDDARLSTDMYVVFSLNVDVNETLYEPDDDILSAVRDAADADFPGVANAYEDRFGRVAVHGRLSRFDPDTIAAGAATGAWDFTRWAAATREDVTTGRAQIREFSYNRPRTRLVNTYVAYPRADENGVDFDRDSIKDLVRTSPTSITANGHHGKEAPDLIVKQSKQFATDGLTGADLCGLYGDFYIANYAVVRKNVQRVSITSLRPSDSRATDTWALICGVDISDIIALYVDEAGLAGEEFFVEGISGSCRVARPGFDRVTITPNLTPASYYSTDVFTGS
jgi:hypothetical protein